jgi:AmiR/NasT family two-component response regulator
MRWTVLIGAVAMVIAPLGAQQQRPNPERLRAQIAERFMTTYRQQAGLTDDQFTRFERVARASWDARTREDQRRRMLFMALEGQMRPGMAASQDSVGRILDGLMALERERHARAEADLQAYAEFLSPVQRAQLLIMLTRFERQVDQILQQRMGEPGMRRNPPPER